MRVQARIHRLAAAAGHRTHPRVVEQVRRAAAPGQRAAAALVVADQRRRSVGLDLAGVAGPT